VHNRHGTNGFINNNIKSKVFAHSVKTYEQATKSQAGGAMSLRQLRALTLSGEEVHVSGAGSGGGGRNTHSACQPRLVDDYRLHLDSLLGGRRRKEEEEEDRHTQTQIHTHRHTQTQIQIHTQIQIQIQI
jgi:hypothetical protein